MVALELNLDMLADQCRRLTAFLDISRLDFFDHVEKIVVDSE